MEEETIGSFIVRNMLSSGNEDVKKICSPLFNSASSDWNIFPCANEIFLLQSKILLSHIAFKDLSENHTLIPLFKLTGSWYLEDTFKNYLMTYMGPERVKHFRTSVASIGERLTSAIKYCTVCFEEQIYDNGFSWFKREWQITEMSHCLKHSSTLINPRCTVCKNNNTSIRQIESAFNGKCTYCSNKQPNSIHEAFYNPIADWSLKLLNSNFPTFSIQLIRFLVKYSYAQLGGDPKSDKFEIAKYFTKLFSPKLQDKLPVFSSLGRQLTSYRDYEYRMIALLNKRIDEYSLSYTYTPLICLIHPLTLAFSSFDDFKYFLNEISHEIEEERKSTKILDLKFNVDL